MSFTRRIGKFLVIMGALLVALFVLSDLAGSVDGGFLVWGALLLIGGFLVLVGNPVPPPPPNPRFRTMNKILKKDQPDEKKKT